MTRVIGQKLHARAKLSCVSLLVLKVELTNPLVPF